jgi:hypothetical protein
MSSSYETPDLLKTESNEEGTTSATACQHANVLAARELRRGALPRHGQLDCSDSPRFAAFSFRSFLAI